MITLTGRRVRMRPRDWLNQSHPSLECEPGVRVTPATVGEAQVGDTVWLQGWHVAGAKGWGALDALRGAAGEPAHQQDGAHQGAQHGDRAAQGGAACDAREERRLHPARALPPARAGTLTLTLTRIDLPFTPWLPDMHAQVRTMADARPAGARAA